MAIIVKFLIKLVIITIFVYDIYDLNENRLLKEKPLPRNRNAHQQVFSNILGSSDSTFFSYKFTQELEQLFNPNEIIETFPILKQSIDLNTNIIITTYYCLILLALAYNLLYDNIISIILLSLDNLIKLYLFFRVYILSINFEDFIGHIKMCMEDIYNEDYKLLYLRHNEFTKNNKFIFICLLYIYFTIILISMKFKKYNKNRINRIKLTIDEYKPYSENSSNL